MLSDAICTTEQLRRLLDTSPSLHKLELASCDAVVEPDPMEILRFLAATADGTMSLLPNLQHLHYFTDSYTWTAELWALTPKVLGIQDIHSPNRRQLKTLSFDISGDIGDKELGDLICKDKNVVMRLADAVRSGTEIELLHYSSRDVLKLSLAHHQLTLS
ncbi:hypothetical protein JR316_0009157 [Psilocybe cubensis]|nr:hypothetical protein JR316_0009157 [Psilocybe cubensis]KAH9478699.1 hypothetical protein JR316_0009157 [Psilocybe cubensis]